MCVECGEEVEQALRNCTMEFVHVVLVLRLKWLKGRYTEVCSDKQRDVTCVT